MTDPGPVSLDKLNGVCVSIPASKAYLGVVRLAASGVAALHGFDIAQIEDIKTAACEACFYLMSVSPRGLEICVAFDYDAEDKALHIEVTGQGAQVVLRDGHAPDPQLAACILETLVDEVHLTTTGEGLSSIAMRALREHEHEPG